MNSQRNIFIAFILNLSFSVFELLGGLYTGSFAILSDSLHDLGDATGIGLSYLFEKRSKKAPDNKYTYGYARYSVIGSVIMTLILILSSITIVYNAIHKLFNPSEVNYNGMIILAIIGTAVNILATIITHKGNSLNQKAVNLHMLEDVLGWLIVLIGAIVMKFTGITIIDPILSIAVALFVFISSIKTLISALSVLLEKVPDKTQTEEIRKHLCDIDDVTDVHHIHLWSMDGNSGYATMHIVTDGNPAAVKENVKKVLNKYHIFHSTLELETTAEDCKEKSCKVSVSHHKCAHHHH